MGDDYLAPLIQRHVARYPASGVQDIYKLLHQGTFGPGHAISDKKVANEQLEQDAQQAGPLRSESLIESVHPEGHVVRLHVRPYLAQGGQLKWLLEAFIRSASAVNGDPAVMAARWQAFADMCQPGGPLGGEFPTRELRLFGMMRAAEHWPAVQHTPAFCAAYTPCYRVLVAGEAAALCARLGVSFEIA